MQVRETLIKAFPSRKSQARSAFPLRFSVILPEVSKETLIKAFPSPDLRCEAAISSANPCDPPEGSKEALN